MLFEKAWQTTRGAKWASRLSLSLTVTRHKLFSAQRLARWTAGTDCTDPFHLASRARGTCSTGSNSSGPKEHLQFCLMDLHVELGVLENKMEATILENQIEKKIENEMETGIIVGLCLV